MQLIRKTLQFGGLPDLYTFECEACGETHMEEAAAPEAKGEWTADARLACRAKLAAFTGRPQMRKMRPLERADFHGRYLRETGR